MPLRIRLKSLLLPLSSFHLLKYKQTHRRFTQYNLTPSPFPITPLPSLIMKFYAVKNGGEGDTSVEKQKRYSEPLYGLDIDSNFYHRHTMKCQEPESPCPESGRPFEYSESNQRLLDELRAESVGGSYKHLYLFSPGSPTDKYFEADGDEEMEGDEDMDMDMDISQSPPRGRITCPVVEGLGAGDSACVDVTPLGYDLDLQPDLPEPTPPDMEAIMAKRRTLQLKPKPSKPKRISNSNVVDVKADLFTPTANEAVWGVVLDAGMGARKARGMNGGVGVRAVGHGVGARAGMNGSVSSPVFF